MICVPTIFTTSKTMETLNVCVLLLFINIIWSASCGRLENGVLLKAMLKYYCSVKPCLRVCSVFKLQWQLKVSIDLYRVN